MGKIKGLLIHNKKNNLDIYYMENGDICINEIDIACHYMSFNAWAKANKDQEYIKEWIEKNVEIIEVKEACELFDYLIEWEDIIF